MSQGPLEDFLIFRAAGRSVIWEISVIMFENLAFHLICMFIGYLVSSFDLQLDAAIRSEQQSLSRSSRTSSIAVMALYCFFIELASLML
jgi:hypothetical protein